MGNDFGLFVYLVGGIALGIALGLIKALNDHPLIMLGSLIVLAAILFLYFKEKRRGREGLIREDLRKEKK